MSRWQANLQRLFSFDNVSPFGVAKGSGEAQRLACLLRRLPAMFLNQGTMRLPGTIVHMRTARVPQKKRQRGESKLSPRYDAGS